MTDSAAKIPGRPWGFLVVALWAGLLVGLVEVGLFLTRVRITQHGLWRQSPHVVWMIPLANLALFALAGVLLAIFVRPLPRVGKSLASGLLATLVLMTPWLSIPGIRAASCLILAAGLACWLVPAIHARATGFATVVRRSLPMLALAVLLLGGIAFGQEYWARRAAEPTGPAPPGAPNVLLIVMDTVRADATSLNGAERDTTPNLAAFARRGARFERANATSSWTLPSHASLFTGRWPWELHVGPDRPLDDRFPTLAEHLGRHGYDTAGFVANGTFCTVEYGLGRGFRHYEDFVVSPLEALRASALGWLIARRLVPVLDRARTAAGREASHPLEWRTHRKPASEINRAALDWVARRGDRPFFAFLNYIDVHDPYLVPDGAARPFHGRPYTLDERRALREWIDERPRDRTPEQFQLARDAYDDCLAYLDSQIGRLFAELDRLGHLENTIVVVTSDHGEQFGDHQRDGLPLAGHRLTVYQPEVFIPLVVVAPDARIPPGTVVADPVSLRDLPSTILDLAGLAENAPFPGRSIVPAATAGEPGGDGSASGAVLAEFSPNESEPATVRYQTGTPGLMRAVIADGASYHRQSDGREELYDLENDPLESTNLVDDPDYEETLGRLREALDGFEPATR